MPGWTTSQPQAVEVADQARDAALVARDRARRQHHRVARPGGHVAVLAEADHRERRERLALAARDEHERARGEGVAECCGLEARRRRRAAAGRGRAPSRCCRSCGGRGRRSAVPPRRRAPATVWIRGTEVAKQETSTRPRVRASTSSKAGTTASSPGVCPGCSTLVLSESSASTPRSPHSASASTSVRSLGLRLRVDLEVAARQHDAGRASRSRAPGCRRRCARRGSDARGTARSRRARRAAASAARRARRAPAAAAARSRA